jgi:hypothetical protein
MLERQQVHGSLAVVQIVLLLLVFSIRSTISWVLPFFVIAGTQLTYDIRLKSQDVGFARAFGVGTKTLLATGWWP